MKYERLTAKDRYWENEELWTVAQELTFEEIDEIYNRLAELEDKIEAGTLAEVGKLFIEYDEIGGGYLICKYGKQSKGVEFNREAAE